MTNDEPPVARKYHSPLKTEPTALPIMFLASCCSQLILLAILGFWRNQAEAMWEMEFAVGVALLPGLLLIVFSKRSYRYECSIIYVASMLVILPIEYVFLGLGVFGPFL